MNNEFEYYILERDDTPNAPLLDVDNDIDSMGTSFLYCNEMINVENPVYISFATPIPPKPKMVDFHLLGASFSVFSKRIYSELSKHIIKGLQLVPAIITNKQGEEYNDYWISNVYQTLAVFDQENTKYKRKSKLTGDWLDIEKIHLDKEILSRIPLEDRLVFVSEENGSFILFHKFVVDIIMSVKPEGILPVLVEEWSE